MAKKNSESNFMLIGLAVLAAAGYFIYQEKMQQAKKTSPVVPIDVNKKYPIVFGGFNEDLKQLQFVLGVTQDGIFGPNTLAALKQFGYDYTNYQTVQFYAEIKSMIDRINAYAGN